MKKSFSEYENSKEIHEAVERLLTMSMEDLAKYAAILEIENEGLEVALMIAEESEYEFDCDCC